MTHKDMFVGCLQKECPCEEYLSHGSSWVECVFVKLSPSSTPCVLPLHGNWTWESHSTPIFLKDTFRWPLIICHISFLIHSLVVGKSQRKMTPMDLAHPVPPSLVPCWFVLAQPVCRIQGMCWILSPFKVVTLLITVFYKYWKKIWEYIDP